MGRVMSTEQFRWLYAKWIAECGEEYEQWLDEKEKNNE